MKGMYLKNSNKFSKKLKDYLKYSLKKNLNNNTIIIVMQSNHII